MDNKTFARTISSSGQLRSSTRPILGHGLPHYLVYLAAVAAAAVAAARLPSDPVANIAALCIILAGLWVMASLLQGSARRAWRRDRDRRLGELARSRVPLVVRHRRERVDRALHAGISGLADGEDASRVVMALERGTGSGGLLPRGMPRLY